MCQYFRDIKSARRRGFPSLPERVPTERGEKKQRKKKISLNSVEQPNKNYTEYLSSMLFLFDFSHSHPADQCSTTHVPHIYFSPCRNISDEGRSRVDCVATRTLYATMVDVWYVNTRYFDVFPRSRWPVYTRREDCTSTARRHTIRPRALSTHEILLLPV